MVQRNAGLPREKEIRFRIGIHLGDVMEESESDLMRDGVNIAARLQSICEPAAICISEPAYWQVRSKLDLYVKDLGNKELKNIPEPVHVLSLEVGKPAQSKLAEPQSTPRVAEPPPLDRRPTLRQYRRQFGAGISCRRRHALCLSFDDLFSRG